MRYKIQINFKVGDPVDFECEEYYILDRHPLIQFSVGDGVKKFFNLDDILELSITPLEEK